MADDYIKGLLSTGEVLLIDTKQHWVAALRYAIRPLLLAGLVVLLALLNQWLKFDTLSFINDIVNWILIIAIVVTLIWLPVDLAQWWSRRYVLTNRRAMRMQGILRKSSYDCSLEQINDILLSQSVLGRRLGYADLTLLTANSSNEAYEQLLDGPQFKKAVLDAKEAIRSGQPLERLPDGFVVRGGTNDASIRAFAKGSNAEAGVVSAAGATTGTVAGASAASPLAPTEPTASTASVMEAASVAEEAWPAADPPITAVEPPEDAVAPVDMATGVPASGLPQSSATSAAVADAVTPEADPWPAADTPIEDAETAADARGAVTGSMLDAPAEPEPDVVDEATDLVEDAASTDDDIASATQGGPSAA